MCLHSTVVTNTPPQWQAAVEGDTYEKSVYIFVHYQIDKEIKAVISLSDENEKVCSWTTERKSCVAQIGEEKEVILTCSERAEHATHPCICSNLSKQQPQDTQGQHTLGHRSSCTDQTRPDQTRPDHVRQSLRERFIVRGEGNVHRDLIDHGRISALIFCSALFNHSAVSYVQFRRLNILVWWLERFISWWVGAGQTIKCVCVLPDLSLWTQTSARSL